MEQSEARSQSRNQTSTGSVTCAKRTTTSCHTRIIVNDKMKTEIYTLIKAMRILSVDIQSKDGIANAAILEAAERLQELHEENERLKNESHPKI